MAASVNASPPLGKVLGLHRPSEQVKLLFGLDAALVALERYVQLTTGNHSSSPFRYLHTISYSDHLCSTVRMTSLSTGELINVMMCLGSVMSIL
jgi:hypothetical protein